jgi:DNA-directed RNA polymerase subunit alpha
MRIRWRGLELPSQLQCDRATLTATYGKFVAEPFERGFGVTIGNSLRRILLSSLEGSAITQVKIHDAQHEFTSMPGVVEDVTDIVLNIKSLVVKNHTDSTRVVRVKKNQRGIVTGADVHGDDAVEVINKHLLIATLTDDVPFEVEMVVENGRGYVPANEHSPNVEIGIIPVDAVYSPVVRVRYEIEETRVGQKTNYDKLTLEIWTNGSLGPELALVEAAKILRKHLNPFVQYTELGPQVFGSGRGGLEFQLDAGLEAKLAMSVAELKLSGRAFNCLESQNISTVRDLVSRTPEDLLDVRNFGETTLNEVRERLGELGLRLGMRLPAPTHV